MSKILVVFGATGQQGGSVVQMVLKDPELSQQFKIRAITRDVNSAKAQQLKKHVEVVSGDPAKPDSLKDALTGAHTVFALTVPSFTPDGYTVEYNSAKAIADSAVQNGAKYIVFSTLPAVKKISGDKYTKAIHFDAKADVEEYIRKLPIQSAFVSLGGYMENYNGMEFFKPRKISDDTWALPSPLSPTAKLPLISSVEDTGKFVGAILAEPAKYEGKTFAASFASYTMDEITDAMSKSTGQKVIWNYLDRQQFQKALPPILDEAVADVFDHINEFGYYGPSTDEQVAWAVSNARGKLCSLEEFFKLYPLQLK